MDLLPSEIIICEIIEKYFRKPTNLPDLLAFALTCKGIYNCIIVSKPWRMHKILFEDEYYTSKFHYPTFRVINIEIGPDYRYLAIACQKSIEVFKWVIQEFRVIHNDIYTFNILRKACQYGNLDVVKYLFEEWGMDLDYLRQNIVYREACLFGQLEIMKYFVEEIGLTKEDIERDKYRAIRCARARRKYSGIDKYLKKQFDIGNIGQDYEYYLSGWRLADCRI